jgi:protein SCO1
VKKRNWYIWFFVILIGAFWAILWFMSDVLKKKVVAISIVQPFNFINQDSNTITTNSVKNKVYIAEFFFTTCTGICPKMNTNLKQLVYEKYKHDTNFVILSHTVTPDIDDANRLRKYADSLKVDTKRWHFLTGKKEWLYDAARKSYLVDDPKNNITDTMFLHTQFVALVDKQLRVRAIYDATYKQEMMECNNKIAELLKE